MHLIGLILSGPYNTEGEGEMDKYEVVILSGGKLIKPLQTFKHLGIWLSENLKWEHYFSKLMSQLGHRLSTLRQLARYASPKTIKIVARATIISKIEYAIQLFGGCKIE